MAQDTLQSGVNKNIMFIKMVTVLELGKKRCHQARMNIVYCVNK